MGRFQRREVSHFVIKQRAPHRAKTAGLNFGLLRPGKDLRQLSLAFYRLFGFCFRAVNQTVFKLGEPISKYIRYRIDNDFRLRLRRCLRWSGPRQPRSSTSAGK